MRLVGGNDMKRFLIIGLILVNGGGALGADFPVANAPGSDKHAPGSDKHDEPSKDLLAELKAYTHKIVYETNRDGNWELYLMNADGSDPVNLTRTPDVDELYPKPSPDG